MKLYLKGLLLIILLTIPVRLLAPISSFSTIGVDVPLLYAIVSVESSFNLNAVNKAENALGLLQIRGCVIDDVNWRYGLNFTHEDAFNPIKAVQIFEYYTKMYGARTVRDKVMVWNMGPKAMKYKNYTNTYYKKVMGLYSYYKGKV